MFNTVNKNTVSEIFNTVNKNTVSEIFNTVNINNVLDEKYELLKTQPRFT